MKSRKKAITAESRIRTGKTSPVTQPAPVRDVLAAHVPERVEGDSFNKKDYILGWLSGEPQNIFSPIPDMDKRLDILLNALHRERKNVLQFKIKQNKS